MRRLVGLLGLVGVAHADAPKLAPAPPPPAACIPPDSTLLLYVRDGKAITCPITPDPCWAVEQGGSTVTSVPRPKPVADTAIATTQKNGKVCLGTVCKKAGKRVARLLPDTEIATFRAADEPWRQRLHLTPDHAVVVVEGDAFVLATDKPLAMKPPVEFTTLHDPPAKKPVLLRAQGAGQILIATWAPCVFGMRGESCSDDSPMAVAVDTKGKTASSWFPPGEVIELDADRLVVIGTETQTQVTSLSPVTGKMIGAYTMSDGNIVATGAKVSADMVVVLTKAGGYDVRWVSVPKDKPPASLSRQTIPTCPRVKKP
jgi:hypothetical protein